MADVPIMTDVNINGQIEKFADPQHFTGSNNEGRARTGEKNPLPTRDSDLKTELELIKQQQQQILERLDNPIDTQLTGSNVEKGLPVQVEKDFIEVRVQGDELEAGKNQTFDVYSNEGEIWTLKRFGYYANRNQGLSGNHFIYMYHGDRASNENFILSISNEVNQFMRGTIPGRREDSFSGNITPDNNYEMVETIRDTTVLSNKLPLRIQYRNRGDGALSGLSLTLLFMVEKVNNVGR